MTASNVCQPRQCAVCYYTDQLSCDRPECPTRPQPASSAAEPAEGAAMSESVDTTAEAVDACCNEMHDITIIYDGAWAAEAADRAIGLLRALAKERDQLRDTNRRLNQRCQAAEASLPDYRKIIAVPPDGDGVRFVSGNLGRALAVTMCAKLNDQLAEQETLLAERNRQNAAAFADRDALLADQRRLLYLASTASMNWGHRDRAGYTLDPLQFESGRDVIYPDDFRKAIDAAMAGPCPTCHDSGLVTIRGMCGGVEMDCDDQPCPDCADIREAAMGAKEGM